MNGNSNSAIPNSGSINVKLNAEELQLIIGALDEKHNAYVNSGAEVLPDLQAVNRLYNRLSECRLEIFAKGLARDALRQAANQDLSLQDVTRAYNRVRGGDSLDLQFLFRIWRPNSGSTSRNFTNGSRGR
jgi:hypothetical protein